MNKMENLKYFGYTCIGLGIEVLSAVIGAAVTWLCISLTFSPVVLLLPFGLGIGLVLAFGRLHRRCRRKIRRNLEMKTWVYSVFAQILPIAGCIGGFVLLQNALVESRSMGAIAVWFVALIGGGVAVLTAVAGWIYDSNSGY